MRVIEPSHEFLEDFDGVAMLKNIERMGRICYKSEGNITETSYQKFLKNLIARGHESVIEHGKDTNFTAHMRHVETRTYGSVHFSFFQ